jgi:hypothetical protein
LKSRAGALNLLLACLAFAACSPELDWREISVPEGRFAVLLPGRVRHESRTLAAAGGTLIMTMYSFSLERGTMGVAYIDYPGAAPDAAHVRARLDAARDALLRNFKGGAPSEEDIRVDGIQGRQVYAEGPAGAAQMLLKARFFAVGSRVYQVAYVGAKDGAAMADVDMFLTSFKLLK